MFPVDLRDLNYDEVSSLSFLVGECRITGRRIFFAEWFKINNDRAWVVYDKYHGYGVVWIYTTREMQERYVSVRDENGHGVPVAFDAIYRLKVRGRLIEMDPDKGCMGCLRFWNNDSFDRNCMNCKMCPTCCSNRYVKESCSFDYGVKGVLS